MTVWYAHLSPERLRDAVTVLDADLGHVLVTFANSKGAAVSQPLVFLGVPNGI